MPDILQQLIIYGLFFFIVLFLVIRIAPTLFAKPKPKHKDDDNQELCTGCGYDVRALLRCPECGKPTREARRQHLAKLREQWPTETIALRVPDHREQPVVILTTDDSLGGRLLCQHLEARGIPANLNEIQGVALAAYTVGKTSYRLTVWSADDERSRAIIEHLWPKELRSKSE